MFPQVKTQLSLSQKNFLVIEARKTVTYIIWKTGIPRNDSPYSTRSMSQYTNNMATMFNINTNYIYFYYWILTILLEVCQIQNLSC